MLENIPKMIAIVIYMVTMLGIGWYAFRKTTNLTDYMLGGRSLGPAVTALSAGASDMSGWLLMGLPGGIYLTGLSNTWIAIGLSVGAYLNWLFVAPRLRTYTEVSGNSITIPSFLENRFKDSTKLLRIVSSIVILIFFTFYISSGMVAGAVFFENSFSLPYLAGLLLVSGVVVAYTLFGGFLAVSWTDFVQGLIMLLALILVPLLAMSETGGFANTVDTIRSIDPSLLDLFTGITGLGIISAVAWGLGYVGQPHIIVRFMAIRSVQETKTARRIGMGWMVASLLGASLTALVGLAFFTQTDYTLSNPEAVFIQLGQILFHPFIAGLVLAAVLAAIMSTVSSQLIVTSSALTEDLYKLILRKNASDKELVFFGRMAVLTISVIACLLALGGENKTILGLVAYAWAGFGASFGPVIVLSLYWRKMTNWGAIAGMLAGATTVIIWKNIDLQITKDIYEIIPGFIVNLIVSIVISLFTYQRDEAIEKEFDTSLKLLHTNVEEA
ncbi:sodium/proline symporter PutP [Paenibacillus thiaminolyticus]|uniref:Sodium/proline symporter n=1 Tax=Paenibacillus thiaminolyticus TaxID=49283 RepID=A0A3A3GKI7_PANTH|nr:sodium/proline symporter PutP [Paenibacillus thiaminolyticus]RJG25484.1 sodium/proline symporter PutP [Paenibacillus thiaminolyticus]